MSRFTWPRCTRARCSIALCSLVLGSISGCYDSFVALEARDGGAADATRTTDADMRGDSAADGGGAPCERLAQWLDEPPIVIASTESPIVIAAAQDRFDVAYVSGPPPETMPCARPCRVSTTLSTTGRPMLGSVISYGWGSYDAWRIVPVETQVFDARRGGGSRTMLIARSLPLSAWQQQVPADARQRDGTFATGGDGTGTDARLIGDISPGAEGTVLIATYERDPLLDDGPRSVELRVTELDLDGTERREHEIDTLGSPFDRPRLVMARGATRAWIAYTQSWDFPTTVQISEVGGPARSIHGSSCGVTTYDAAAHGEDEVFVVQDCIAPVETRLEWRTMREGESDLSTQVYAADIAASTVASRIAVDPRGLAWVAYLPGGSDSVRVAAYRVAHAPADVAALERVVELEVPSAPELAGNPIAHLAIAAADDGTVAVGWSVTSLDPEVGGHPRAALARLRVCE